MKVKDVCTGGRKVDTAEVPVYATVDEILASEPAERVVTVFNKGNAVRIMGNVRAKHSPTRVGKNRRFNIAYELLPSIVSEDVLDKCIGNIVELKRVMDSKEVQDAVDDYLQSQQAPAEAVDDELEEEGGEVEAVG